MIEEMIMATIMTAEVFSEIDPSPLPSDALYEVINGVVVENSLMGSYPVEIASILHEYLGPFARRTGVGRAIVEMLFRIDSATQYRPDVAFVSHEKWPVGRRTPNSQPWEVVPDVAIEVISESDRGEEVLRKTLNYLKAGVRAVWLIYPSLETIHIFDSFTQIRVLTRDDVLDGGQIIPGFRLPMSSLFEGEEVEEEVREATH